MPPRKKPAKLTQEELFPHMGFPYRLAYNEDGNNKTCWFQCEWHLTKHVTRYRISTGKIDVAEGHALKVDPLAPKPKRKRKPSGTKASQASTTKKATKPAAKTTRTKRTTKTAKKEAFSNLDTFFDQ